MLLVLTASDDATADYLCGRLAAEGVAFVRVDTDRFAENGFVEYRNGEPVLLVNDQRFGTQDFKCVWYRRPRGVAVAAVGTEAQRLHTSREWGASLDGFLAGIPLSRWMNHPAANARAGSKMHQLALARRLGLLVPDSIVTRSVDEARAFWASHPGAVITKPLSTGSIEAADGTVEARILTSSVQLDHLQDAELLARCPTLLQARVEKGVDARVTIVDRDVHALEASPAPGIPVPLDIRQDGMADLIYERIRLPQELETKLFALCDQLELRFAAVDLVKSNRGEWFFLEVNPNGQWAWLDIIGAADIAATFVRAFQDD